MWRRKSFCDVEVVVGGCRLPAHKLVLAATSDYMRALLENPRFEDSTSEQLTLVDMTVDTAELVLEFMYTGACDVRSEQLEPVLGAACRLQVTNLIVAIAEELCKLVDASNCGHLIQLAERYSLAQLENAASHAMREHFEGFAKTDSLLAVSKACMIAVLADDRTVAHESTLFLSAVRWLEAQGAATDEALTTELMNLVRFPLMPLEFVDTHVLPSPIMQSAGCARVLATAFKEGKFQQATARCRPRCIVPPWEGVGSAGTGEDGITVDGKVVTLNDSGAAALDVRLHAHSGLFEIKFRLLQDSISTDCACTCFGLVRDNFAPVDSDGDWQGCEDGWPGAWFLRRYANKVYSERVVESHSDDDEAIDFPVGAIVCIRCDTDAATASYTVSGQAISNSSKNIGFPVRPFVMSYGGPEEDADEACIELIDCRRVVPLT